MSEQEQEILKNGTFDDTIVSYIDFWTRILTRVITLPFFLGTQLIFVNYIAIKRAVSFLIYGGEIIHYEKTDKASIQHIYDILKQESYATKQEEKKSKRSKESAN